MSYTVDVKVGGSTDVRETTGLTITKVAVGRYDNNAYLLRCRTTGAQLLIDAAAESQIASRLEATRSHAVEFDPLEMDRFTRFQELTRMMAESVNDVATVQRSMQQVVQ